MSEGMGNWRSYLFTALQAVVVVVFIWVMFTLDTPWNAERVAGTILALIGLSLVSLARFQLGTSFSVQARATKLVTHGLYAKIRNPVYVFGTVVLVGIILILQAPALWILLAGMVVVQVLRARREAAVLEAAFGDEYRAYRRKTWF